jgi:hypothetical protein
MASFGSTVLFGNNEDWFTPHHRYWAEPSREGRYGVWYLGDNDLHLQGAVNEKGLALDGNGLPEAPLNPHPERSLAQDGILTTMMREAATVEEAVVIAETYNWGSYLAGQVLLADSTGDAVVISAGADGELAFTRKPPGDGFLASTNFNRANPKNRYGSYPGWRYETAIEMLDQIQGEADLTVDTFRSILDATHQEGLDSPTIYSNVIDLRHGMIYLYYGHQYDEVVTLDVAEEIASASMPTRIRDLFSQETRERAERGLPKDWETIETWTPVGWGWLLLTALSLAYVILSFVIRVRPSIRTILAWVAMVTTFGPIGLAAYLLSRRKAQGGDPWRRAMATTICRMAGYVLWITFVFVYIIVIMRNFKFEIEFGSILLLTYVLPFVLGLLILAAPLAASRLGIKYWQAVRRAILTEFISINLAFVGIFYALQILVDWWFPEVTDVSSPVFWFMMAIAAVVGAILLYPFDFWMARREFLNWPAWLSFGDKAAERVTALPTLRNAWGALTLSLALFAGSLGLVAIIMN